MKVFKFGGGVLKNFENIKKCVQIVQNSHDRIVIVVSALANTTNLLENILFKYYKNSDFTSDLLQLKNFHLNFLNHFFPKENPIFYEFEFLFEQLQNELKKQKSVNFDYDYDRIIVFGEKFSSLIFSKILENFGVKNHLIDIQKVVKTDNNYRQANVISELTEANIRKIFNFSNTQVYVTQGFIASDRNNNSTTLGREGSDYTATLIASALQADISIWKDVDGIFNADPKIFPQAQKFDYLDYHESLQLTFYGAKVLHYKTILPAQKKNLPISIKSIFKPQQKGTVIKHFEDGFFPKLPSLILKQNQSLIKLNFEGKFIDVHILENVFSILKKTKVKFNLWKNSANEILLVVDDNELKINELINEFEKIAQVRLYKNLTLLTIRNYKEKECFFEQMIKKCDEVFRITDSDNKFYICKNFDL